MRILFSTFSDGSNYIPIIGVIFILAKLIHFSLLTKTIQRLRSNAETGRDKVSPRNCISWRSTVPKTFFSFGIIKSDSPFDNCIFFFAHCHILTTMICYSHSLEQTSQNINHIQFLMQNHNHGACTHKNKSATKLKHGNKLATSSYGVCYTVH